MARQITRGNTRRSTATDVDEEEKPSRRAGSRRPRRDTSEPTKGSISKGWDSFNKYAEETKGGDFADDLEVEDDAIIIKFLDDDPITYKQHWIEGLGKGKKKSYVCLDEGNGGCPLCDDLGDKPRAIGCFNVVDFTDPDEPVVKVLRQGPQVNNMLINFAKDTKKTGPLTRPDVYFAISKSTVNKKVQYSVLPVKARDLADDWDIEELSEEDLDRFDSEAYEEEQIIRSQTRAELEEIVQAVL
jgi:hypothetical protein